MVVSEGNFPYIITSSESWVVWYTSFMMNWLETLVTMTIITANPPIFSAKKLSHHSGTDGGGLGVSRGYITTQPHPKWTKTMIRSTGRKSLSDIILTRELT